MSDRSDNFNRADGAIGSPSDGGSAWVSMSGTWTVASNQVKQTAGGVGEAYLEASASDMVVQVTGVTFANDIGVIARLADISNYLLFRGRPGSKYDLYKQVGGSFTLLAGGLGSGPSNGDVLKLTCAGSTLTAAVNGTTLTTQSDSAGQTNTKWGLRFGTNDIGDDFSAAAGTGGGILFTQLERGVRGYERGVYSGSR